MMAVQHHPFHLKRYQHYWTTRRNDYRLVTINYCGSVELLIFHVPSKRVITMPNLRIEKAVIAEMLDKGCCVVDDNLLSKPTTPLN